MTLASFRPLGLILPLLLATIAEGAPPPTQLELSLSVTGAKVEVDDRTVAEAAASEFVVAVVPGAHTLRVTKDGFTPLVKTVDVAVGATVRVELLLRVANADKDPRRRAPVRIAVYELVAGEGVSTRTSSLVSEAILTEVRKLERTAAVGMNEIGEMLSFEQKRQLLGCDDQSCLAEISGALGVDELVSGTVGLLGASTLFSIRRIDLREAKVLGAVTRRFTTGTGEELLAAIGPAVEELFPEFPLRSDRTRGTSIDVANRLNPPPIPKWAFFATAGTSVVALVVGGVFGSLAVDAEAQHKALADRSLVETVPGRDLDALADRSRANVGAANVAFAVAGGLALVAAVEAFFTDWQGYGGDTVPKRDVTIQPATDGAAVIVRF